MGRLRQPGTCTLFSTVADLGRIVQNNENTFAVEVASLIMANRYANRVPPCFSTKWYVYMMRVTEYNSVIIIMIIQARRNTESSNP